MKSRVTTITKLEFKLPPNDQILMGSAIALLCLFGLVKSKWLLSETSKGKKLVSRYGESKAFKIIVSFLVVGALFGILLATGMINHLQWE